MTYQADLWATALRLGLSLGVVLLICWGALVLSRRFMQRTPVGGGSGSSLLKVLGHHYLGMKRSLTLVKIPGAVLVLGITADRIQLLSRIDNPEELAALEIDTQAVRPNRFADHLARFTGSRKAGGDE
jgi:flagellar biogenesis protein FliO